MNTKITFNEIVDLIAESTSTSKRVCELFLRELFSTVSQTLIDGEEVKIKGVGTFKMASVKSRKSVNVTTGEAMVIKGHSKITFTPDKSLSEAVNQPFAQFETVYLDDAVTDEKLAAIDKEYPSLFDSEADSAPTQNEPAPAAEPEQQVEPSKPVEPIKQEPQAEPEDHAGSALVEPVEPVASVEPIESEASVEPAKPAAPGESVEPAAAKPVSRPMLVGIPIDGPTQPKPEPEPVEGPAEDEYFYRPAPRNTYTPTPEQLAAAPRKFDKRWIALAIGVLAACLLGWLLMKGCSKAESSSEAVAAADSDTVALAVEEPAVVTETVTSQVVLSTMADKHYGSTSQVVLSTMADKHYGSQWFWVYIYEENKDKIDDPDNVPIGTVVVIPPAEKYGIDVNDPESLKKAQRRSWEILKSK